MTTQNIPKIGDFLSTADCEMIYEAISQRHKNFPDEPEIMTVTLVLMNIGNRYTPVECVEQEWSGLITDVPAFKPGQEKPRCPNGHEIDKGLPLKLAWLS